jgi:hypothetical protein
MGSEMGLRAAGWGPDRAMSKGNGGPDGRRFHAGNEWEFSNVGIRPIRGSFPIVGSVTDARWRNADWIS